MKKINFWILACLHGLFKKGKITLNELSKSGTSHLFFIHVSSLTCGTISCIILLSKEYIPVRFSYVIKIGVTLSLISATLELIIKKKGVT